MTVRKHTNVDLNIKYVSWACNSSYEYIFAFPVVISGVLYPYGIDRGDQVLSGNSMDNGVFRPTVKWSTFSVFKTEYRRMLVSIEYWQHTLYSRIREPLFAM